MLFRSYIPTNLPRLFSVLLQYVGFRVGHTYFLLLVNRSNYLLNKCLSEERSCLIDFISITLICSLPIFRYNSICVWALRTNLDIIFVCTINWKYLPSRKMKCVVLWTSVFYVMWLNVRAGKIFLIIFFFAFNFMVKKWTIMYENSEFSIIQ